MNRERVKTVVGQMTLKEKAALTSIGADLGTVALPRLKVPSLKLPSEFSLFGASSSVDEIPSFFALGHSFDPHLIGAFAALRSRLAMVEGESYGGIVPLGAVRKPFDTDASGMFSDEPYLVGRFAAAYIDGCILPPVGCNLLNVGGYERSIDERALGEIYMSPFVRLKSRLKALALPSGLLGGVPTAENRDFMKRVTDGFDGLIFTESGSAVDKAEEVSSGACLDILTARDDETRLMSAVSSGLLYEPKLNCAVERTVFAAAERYNQVRAARIPEISDAEKEGLYLKAAEESAVLLKNDGVLPLESVENLAVYGKADIEGARLVRPDFNEKTAARAEKLAAAGDGAETVLVFSERADCFVKGVLKRFVKTLSLRAKVVLVLSAPRYFELDGLDCASAIVYMPYFGKRGGEALGRLLTAESDFVGRLTCAWAKDESAYPYNICGGSFGGGYCGESVYVGNRYFSTFGKRPYFKSGFGLCYSQAEAEGLEAEVRGGNAVLKFRARTAGALSQVAAVVSARSEEKRIFGLGERIIGFDRINLNGEFAEFSLNIDLSALNIFDGERYLLPKGEWIVRLELGAAAAETVLKITDGDECEKYSPEEYAGYFADDGKLKLTARDAEKLLGCAAAAEHTPPPSELKKAEKILYKHIVSNVPKKDELRRGRALENAARLNPFSKIKAAKALREKGKRK